MRPDFAQRVAAAAASIPPGPRPTRAAILGSGLSGVASGLGMEEIPFSAIAGFPEPTVAGHAGILYRSEKALIMAGRFHSYEGHPLDDVVLPTFLLAALGARELIVTNAAGAVNQAYRPGDLVLIRDHLNLMGKNPFIGPNPTEADGRPLGPRFFDMGSAWSAELRERAQAKARQVLGRGLEEGVYAAMSGPSYETPAEVRMLRVLGADLVGMSTVPEALAASYLGLGTLGISCVTNMASGVLDRPLDHAEVVEVGKKAEGSLRALLASLLED